MICTVNLCLGLTKQAAQIQIDLIPDTRNALHCLIILTNPN